MRFLSLIVAVVFASAALGQEVSMEASARPLREVLADISRQTGAHLSSAKEIASEPVTVRFDELSLKRVKEELEHAFYARWRVEMDGFTLLPLPQQEMQAEMAKVQLRRLNASTWSWIDPSDNDETTSRAFARSLLFAMDLRQVAAVPYQKSHVFSTSPRADQLQLPPSFIDLSRRQIEQRNKVATSPLSTDVGTVRLSITHFREPYGYRLGFDVLDSSEKLITEGEIRFIEEQSLGGDQNGSYIHRLWDMKYKAPESKKALSKFISSNYNRDIVLTPQERLFAQVLLHPEEHEPLAIGLGDSLLEMARLLDIDLVAYAGDDVISFGFGGYDEKDPFLNMLSMLVATHEVGGSDSIARLRPYNPVAARVRGNRAAFGRLNRQLASGKEGNLETLSALAMAESALKEQHLLGVATWMFHRDLPKEDLPLLRLYGTLTNRERERALALGGIKVSELSHAAQGAVLEFVRKQPSKYSNFTPGDPPQNAELRLDFLEDWEINLKLADGYRTHDLSSFAQTLLAPQQELLDLEYVGLSRELQIRVDAPGNTFNFIASYVEPRTVLARQVKLHELPDSVRIPLDKELKRQRELKKQGVKRH